MYVYHMYLYNMYTYMVTGRSQAAYTTYLDLSGGIIAAIVISVILSLLCCILIPIAFCCYSKKRTRRQGAVPVVYRGE